MSEKQFFIETGADLSAIAPNEQPEEEIIYDWNGEELSE